MSNRFVERHKADFTRLKRKWVERKKSDEDEINTEKKFGWYLLAEERRVCA